MQNYAVTVGWNNRIAGADTTRMGPAARYVIVLPDTLARAWRLDPNATLQFLLMPTDAVPGPRAAPTDSTAADSTDAGQDRPRDNAPFAGSARSVSRMPRSNVAVHRLAHDTPRGVLTTRPAPATETVSSTFAALPPKPRSR